MAYYETSEFRNGIKVKIDGQPYVMVYFQFVKPGKGTAFTRTKLKNLISGNTLERTYRTGETIEAADCEDVPSQYQYQDGDSYVFMNLETYDTFSIPKSVMDGAENFLTESIEAAVTLYEGRPVGIVLPNFIDVEITYCEPGARGNTANNTNKPATVSTGATVGVPLFVESGEWIRVDTRTGEYVSRVAAPTAKSGS